MYDSQCIPQLPSHEAIDIVQSDLYFKSRLFLLSPAIYTPRKFNPQRHAVHKNK